MADLIVEPGTPDWWGRAAQQVNRLFNRPTAPSKLWQAANTAALPKAAAYPGAVAFHQTLGVPVMSDGTFWYPLSVGAHL